MWGFDSFCEEDGYRCSTEKYKFCCNFVVFPRLEDANQSRTYERSRTEFAAYRFAYLLLPLQHVWHRVVAGELHVAVEHNWLAQDGGDVDRILVANPCKHTIVTINLEPSVCYKRDISHITRWRCIWITNRRSSQRINRNDTKQHTRDLSCLFITNQMVTFEILRTSVPCLFGGDYFCAECKLVVQLWERKYHKK